MKKCGYRNLGCRVNACELDAMREQMEAAGFETVPFDGPADVYVIHTCTVTNIADRKSRQMIHRARHLNPDAVVAAVGCHVQGNEKELLESGDADILIGTNRKNDLADLVRKCLEEREKRAASGEHPSAAPVINDICADIREERDFEEQKLFGTGTHIRANVKVQDGCDRFCSYCRIPLVRGRSRSRSPIAALEEISRLAADGCHEIVLNGIDLSSYHGPAGPDGRKEGLADLVLAAARIEGIERIRFGSLEQGIITPVFLEKLAGCGAFCPQFHLSLQSGSDSVLARMNRHYTTAAYLEKCRLIREYFPLAAITTDVIAGFPGETEEEFCETLAFIREAAFSRIHAFPYSKREGTEAASMDGQLTERVKKERCRELIALGEELAGEFAAKFIGRRVEVLIEETGPGCLPEGYTREYLRACVKSVDPTIPGEKGAVEANTLVSGTVEGVDRYGRLVLALGEC